MTPSHFVLYWWKCYADF